MDGWSVQRANIADFSHAWRVGEAARRRGRTDRITRAETTDRRAVTILELLLVMAVLAMMVAIAVPVLRGSFEGRKLKLAADVVRGEWARARGQAIRTGQEWAFVYEPGTGNYSVQPFSAYEPPQLNSRMAPEDQGNFDYANGLLPRGVTFDRADVSVDARSELLSQDSGGGASSGASLILFYPDGTSQQSRMRVVLLERDWYVQLDLRSLTGTAVVSDIEDYSQVGGSR